ncbi:hypothetical protein DICPUDRAFT_154861 [Dictyostelium purpureum]|uniref:Pseudouridine synthase I TruA alpha/beta domain-containing protein n=1 Tax=Dictyostelium purpureum TaxID=5786 RepID=F0ZSG7_DICPU|nr:uncharacterized protein DICPUDRAFT_154861 [Dictyostelium purpureum]EGC33127.1 hypothetical protein DICPUDRAFT_154861 [Dictyostelium purpureum]|eukprot:XP_003290364.1 hypothetical protein DICPUDRAFT_154861 [Dictyostelium purpureum]
MNDIKDYKDKSFLDKLSKEELINYILSNNNENKNNHQNKNNENKNNKNDRIKKKDKKPNVNFDKCHRRYVAFKVSYVGWPYHGFAAQDCTDETIEGHLIKALKRTSLISDIKTSNYAKSGRTDKGVSAFGQVISLYVRSNLTEGEGIIAPLDQSGGPISNRPSKNNNNNSNSNNQKQQNKAKEEFPYVKMLNGVLPPEIRVLGWAPIPFHFNSRFSTLFRTYKYFFTLNNMDLNLMKEAGNHYLGEHDFSNFCKMDIENVKSFKRVILEFSIEPVNNHNDLYVATIKGYAFLWHQIRCMMAMLFLIGQKKFPVSIIPELLDTSNGITKPPYEMASEIPLVLFDCGYEDLEFIIDNDAQERTLSVMNNLYNQFLIKSQVINLMKSNLTFINKPIEDNTNSNNNNNKFNGEKRKSLTESEQSENKGDSLPTETSVTTTNVSIVERPKRQKN